MPSGSSPNSRANLNPRKSANTRRISHLAAHAAELAAQAPALTDRQIEQLAAVLAPLVAAVERATVIDLVELADGTYGVGS